jgi:FixJ family two-component response regulator
LSSQFGLFSSKTSITVHLNMIERENGQAKRTIRSRISSERWEQIKVAYVSGIGLREIARNMDIPEGTVLAHAKRHGWTQQIQVATQQQSDAITPVQSVPQSLAAILSERKIEPGSA